MPREMLEIPARSVITLYAKDRLRHALTMASLQLVADAGKLEKAAGLAKLHEERLVAEGRESHAFMDSAGALSVAKDYRGYAGEMDTLVERLDATLFVAFVEDED